MLSSCANPIRRTQTGNVVFCLQVSTLVVGRLRAYRLTCRACGVKLTCVNASIADERGVMNIEHL